MKLISHWFNKYFEIACIIASANFNQSKATMSKYLEVLEQIKQLQAQADEIRRAEAESAKQQIKDIMDAYGLSADEVIATIGKPPKVKAEKTKIEALYKDPDSAATWSGRGKPPRWIAGKDRDQFRIKAEQQ